jgi:hypothetical protein
MGHNPILPSFFRGVQCESRRRVVRLSAFLKRNAPRSRAESATPICRSGV